MSKEINKIARFLRANGWKRGNKDGDYVPFHKEGSVGIDMGEGEIVFIDDTGDFAHIPLNYYALVGFVYVHRLMVPIIPATE